MALNSYQLISRVLPGQPFGNGSDGALTVSSNTTQSVANSSCSGSSGSTTLTLASASTFANGNVVLIHQSRGTGAGAWEINRITSGAGGTSLTLQTALASTYTDSGASQAQVFKIPMYSSVTVNNGITWSAPDWGGNTGGILLFACNGISTITGGITASYKGYDGAVAGTGSDGTHTGEGTANASIAWPNAGSPNGNGGAAGYGGGGGGHATAGSSGTGYSPGLGGYAAGSSELTTLVFGGGGGSGATANEYDGAGGAGGGSIIIFSKIITVTGAISSHGYTGENSPNGSGGGGGAGGSIFITTQNATLGSAIIVANGASGGTGVGSPPNNGGIGSEGLIAVHYSSNVSGTTNPTFNQTFDGRLVETSGAIMFF